MKFFTADPRDGSRGGSCDTCCCERLTLRPGETDFMAINYAPWVVPIGNGVQLVPQLEFSYEYDDSACSNAPIDGFVPPSHTSFTKTTAAATPVDIDMATDGVATPGGNTFTYRVSPIAGPSHGSITPGGSVFGNGEFTYTPNGGWVGDDIIWIDQKDAQGRVFTFPIRVTTGTGGPVVQMPTNQIRIDPTQVIVNGRLFEATFPISMPPGTPECAKQRLTVKATARDCNGRLFTHISCYDITTGRC